MIAIIKKGETIMIIQVTTPQLELWQIEGTFSNQPHVHENEFQITIPLFGNCDFMLGNRPYSLGNGGGLVQHPRERHYFEMGPQAGVLIFKVNQDSWKKLTGQENFEFDVRQKFDPGFMREKFRKWTNTLLAYDGGDRLAQEEVESQVLYYLRGTLIGNHKSVFDPAGKAHTLHSDRHLGKVLEYMHASFRNEIRVDDLASMALQSRYHFIRSFKVAMGVTPYQYVLLLRIEEAKRLLKGTGDSVTQISFGLGFSSVSQFQRAFFKGVGCTPKEFRNSGK